MKKAIILKKAIIVVAYDLEREECDDRVVIGPATKFACDIAYDLAIQDPKNSIIFATAGYAGKRWDKVWVARLMQDYIYSKGELPLMRISRAESFTTSGEMACFAAEVSRERDVGEITIAVNSSYAPRAKFLCRKWLQKFNLSKLHISVSQHIHPVTALDFLWELLVFRPAAFLSTVHIV